MSLFGSITSFVANQASSWMGAQGSSRVNNPLSSAVSSVTSALGSYGSPIAGVAFTQAASLLGKTMGGYSSYGFSLNQGLASAAYSLLVNKGIPVIKNIVNPNVVETGLTNQIGFSNDATQLDIRHRISIFSSAYDVRIQCPIQKQIEISTGSSWAALIPQSMVEGLAGLNTFTQGLFGTTLYQRYFSRRIWTGSEPLKLRLPMKFVATTDAYQDVVVPVNKLMNLSLPRVNGQAGGFSKSVETPGWLQSMGVPAGKLTFNAPVIETLHPPGPLPIPEANVAGMAVGDNITIYFGRIVCFRQVILKHVSTVFDSRVDANGKPISADVEVEFETYQMYTSNDMDDAFANVSDTGLSPTYVNTDGVLSGTQTQKPILQWESAKK